MVSGYNGKNIPCRFYGIIIAMFHDDHNSPHFYLDTIGLET